jgi:hypothetical protein
MKQSLKLLLIGVVGLLLAICLSAQAGKIYGPVEFMGNVSMGSWTNTVPGISLSTTNGGAYTTYTNGVYTNFYRMFATNNLGRIPVSAPVSLSWTGSTNTSNAVVIAWSRLDGISTYVIEKSYDAGSTFTNWTTATANTTNFTDWGTNAWSTGDATNLWTLIPDPSTPFLSNAAAFATAAQGVKADAALPSPYTAAGQFVFADGTISLYFTSANPVVIPPTIGGVPVANIAEASFMSSGVPAVTFPYSLTNIAHDAFAYCSYLTNVYFKGNAPSVHYQAFESSTPTIYYIKGATGFAATWAGRPTAEWIDPDNKVMGLILNGSTNTPDPQGMVSFQCWQNAVNVTNFLYSKTSSEVTITGWVGPTNINIVIPDTIDGLPVRSIGDHAFDGHHEWHGTLTLSASLTNIGHASFQDCDGLTGNLVIPEKVTRIGSYAFTMCRSLSDSLTIPATVTSIGDAAFSSTEGLTNVFFYGNAPTIGSWLYTSSGVATNYVTNPTATGWSDTFGGKPVVRSQVNGPGTGLTGVLLYVNPPASNTAAGVTGQVAWTNSSGTNWFYYYDPNGLGTGTSAWVRIQGGASW